MSTEAASNQPVVEGMPQTAPNDQHNRELVKQVHPQDWTNPKPAESYNLAVIGGGTAGLVTAAGAAGLGAKVALIEKHLLGGDCLNVGCVPSKGVISAGRAARAIREAAKFGVTIEGEVKIDFAKAMNQMRETRAEISHHDSADRFSDLGVDVFFGDACFVDDETISIDGQEIKFSSAVIATGSRAVVPPIEGLADVDYLTNETIFSLTELPERMAVVGGGAIGGEMAQAFAQLGSKVTLIQSSAQILTNDDPEAAEVVAKSMESDGVEILYNSRAKRAVQSGDGSITVTIESENGSSQELTVDALLISVGRKANTDGMCLEKVGVDVTKKGIVVDDHMQTTNSNIYAAGDVCFKYKFTHVADFLARNVIQNALFMGSKKASNLVIPYCTYTTPELAAVGVNETKAKKDGIEYDVYKIGFDEIDRTMIERETSGFAKVLTKKGSDKILGATIVGPHAGDLIGEITLAMTHGLGLSEIGSTIHPYPTQAEVLRKLGDRYNKTKLTSTVKWAFDKWLTWRR